MLYTHTTPTTTLNYQLLCNLPLPYICTHVKVKLATLVEGDPKALFSIATTPMCRGGRFSIT